MGSLVKRLPLLNKILFVLNALLAESASANSYFSDAIVNGTVTGNFRLRYEGVNDAAYRRRATGLTLRSRLGYEMAPVYGVSAGIEIRDVRVIAGLNNYQLPTPPAPSQNGYAIIPDPQKAAISNAYIRYRSKSDLDVIYGRQRISLDSQRFLGNAGGRQSDQTFDAISVAYKGLQNWNFYVAHVNHVNGVTDAFNSKTEDDIFNASYTSSVLGKISVYD